MKVKYCNHKDHSIFTRVYLPHGEIRQLRVVPGRTRLLDMCQRLWDGLVAAGVQPGCQQDCIQLHYHNSMCDDWVRIYTEQQWQQVIVRYWLECKKEASTGSSGSSSSSTSSEGSQEKSKQGYLRIRVTFPDPSTTCGRQGRLCMPVHSQPPHMQRRHSYMSLDEYSPPILPTVFRSKRMVTATASTRGDGMKQRSGAAALATAVGDSPTAAITVANNPDNSVAHGQLTGATPTASSMGTDSSIESTGNAKARPSRRRRLSLKIDTSQRRRHSIAVFSGPDLQRKHHIQQQATSLEKNKNKMEETDDRKKSLDRREWKKKRTKHLQHQQHKRALTPSSAESCAVYFRTLSVSSCTSSPSSGSPIPT